MLELELLELELELELDLLLELELDELDELDELELELELDEDDLDELDDELDELELDELDQSVRKSCLLSAFGVPDIIVRLRKYMIILQSSFRKLYAPQLRASQVIPVAPLFLNGHLYVGAAIY